MIVVVVVVVVVEFFMFSFIFFVFCRVWGFLAAPRYAKIVKRLWFYNVFKFLGLDSGLRSLLGWILASRRVPLIEDRVSNEKPSRLDSGLLAAPGLDSRVQAGSSNRT